MRKFMYLLAVLGLVSLAACEKDPIGNGDKPVGPVAGITNVEVPATAEIGSTITVRGEGFDAAVAKLIFADAQNTETLVKSPKFTSMGVSFVVPETLKSGMHTLFCDQNGKIELGKIELTEPKAEITSLKVPSYTGNGKTLYIEGIGFPADAEIELVASSNTVKLTVVDRSNGLELFVPKDAKTGDYKVVMKSGNSESVLSDKITVHKAKTIKAVNQVIRQNLGIEGADFITEQGWSVGLGNNNTLEGFQFHLRLAMPREDPNTGGFATDESGNIIMDEDVMPYDYTFSKSGNKYTFNPTVSEDPHYPFSITIEGGKVTSNTVTRNTGEDNYKWGYDADGHIEKLYASNPNSPYAKFTYKNGALTSYQASSGAEFNHTDAQVMTNPYCPDVVKAMMFFDGNFENYQIAATLLGLDGKNSSSYPNVMTMMDPYTGATSTVPVEYVFDADKFVTSIKWFDEMNMANCSIEFVYY